MTSVDDLFKQSGAFTSASKRKFEVVDPQQSYKSTKLSSTSSPNGHTNGAHNASAEAADNDDDNDDDGDVEAGPELPPEDEDEEGRFFDTGITSDAAEALDYLDEQDGTTYAGDKFDSDWVKRQTLALERRVAKNAELRGRHEGEPQKFMASEADLDAEVRTWSLLSEHPKLYPDFAASGAPALLVGLLAHENTDIAIGTMEIVAELLDEEVEAEQAQWDALAAALLDADLMELVLSNLARLDEEHEVDRGGVYHCLSVVENLAGQAAVAERIGMKRLLKWLCKRMSAPEQAVGQNKQYAAEVLQVLLQSSPVMRTRLLIDTDGVDLFLQTLAAYRRREPEKDSHEEEFVENVFDALTCIVDEPAGKREFMKTEGVELCVIMLREGTKNIVRRALRVLDHAVGGQGAAAAEVCERAVDAALLKPLFSTFMKRTDTSTIEHILGISAALLRSLPGESASRIRVLAKFAEKDFEKASKLVQLRKEYARQIGSVDKEIRSEQRLLTDDEIADREDEWLSRRLDAGLFCLQTTDVIFAWLFAEDPTAVKKKIAAALADADGLSAIRASLEEQKQGLDDKSDADEDTREMLDTLIGCLV